MEIYSFSDAIKQKPILKTYLKSEGGGYISCEIKLYSWGTGTVIKIEGVNVRPSSEDEDIKLIFENIAEYSCNPCISGYLFAVFFSDILYENFLKSPEIKLISGDEVLASNKMPVSTKYKSN